MVVRVRPLNSKEVSDSRKSVVSMNLDEARVSVQSPEAGQDAKSFTFDSVYDANSEQRAVYDETAYPLVESVLAGFNGTIFAVRVKRCAGARWHCAP